VFEEVRAAYSAGLCIVPVSTDGSKRPLVPWRAYVSARPSPDDMSRWRWELQAGFGMISGPVSGCCGSWDFDDAQTYVSFVELAEATGLGEVVLRIGQGYCDSTPSGGTRWIYRYPQDVNWADQVLARRAGRGDEPPTKVLIEHTAFAILAPSDGIVHPSGRPYIRRAGGFDRIASVTKEEHEALVSLARSFDEIHRLSVQEVAGPRTDGARPGDAFAKATSWAAILEPHGWTKVGDRGTVNLWRRPGKYVGVSATTNFADSDLLYVFSTSSAFDPERGYSKFAAYTILNHGGDFSESARELAGRGYGSSTLQPSGVIDVSHRTNNLSISRPLKLTTLRELLAQPDEIVTWIVDQRIAAGSVNVLAGKPKAGKSTLARDLALAVARGDEWIAHRCELGAVWYIALEDKRSEIKRHFRQMGASGEEPVRFLFEQSGDGLVLQLQRLAEAERPALIIVDTLQRLIRAKDLNDYAEVTSRLTPLLILARNSGAAVLLVHHAGKTAREGIDAILGSTAIAGSVDNIFMFIRKDRYRLLSSTQRIGPDLAETVVTMSTDTGHVAGGRTRHEVDLEEMKAAIVTLLDSTGLGMVENEIRERVEGNTALKSKALRTLVEEGKVVRAGGGRRNDPFRYSRSSVSAYVEEREI
jgi:hypothetical protein